MKLFKTLAYLYRYAKDLQESDGLREKDRNESAQLKASAQILKSNLALLEATTKLSEALEQLGKNLEKLAVIRGDSELLSVEDQLNELGIRARLISEFQIPNLVSLISGRNESTLMNPGQPATESTGEPRQDPDLEGEPETE